jgi:hypothetical protein
MATHHGVGMTTRYLVAAFALAIFFPPVNSTWAIDGPQEQGAPGHWDPLHEPTRPGRQLRYALRKTSDRRPPYDKYVGARSLLFNL